MGDLGNSERSEDDWAANLRSYLSIWGLPKVAIIVSAFAPLMPRTIVWIAALAWMGLACILNARRCGWVHCRFTGPFYLILIAPVLLFGPGVFEAGSYIWFALGCLGVFGGYVIMWVTEGVWGRYADPRP